ncbi:hydroxypyruvate isomerase [Litorivicinus lipolyticus]|uniref:Hydroxypyruvate isomerase n=1 Tax=Litorivicinus lipolyticus TaxID=418701 RepID=A0A5Q2QCB1_9GAMM|nr:hydroxypyruvate isomerase [Litorivicinus lipolyticus]QGG79470.1 hydroxypyruvate isomerase [Litorivicinus lipolyticus]
MPKFSANLSMLFTEVAFIDRFQAAAAAGFDTVEYLFPYAHPRHEIAELLATHGLRQGLFNLPAGDWDQGERGIACHPDRIAEFRAGVDKAIAYAKELECPQLNCLAGIVPAGISLEQAQAVLVDNLRYAALKLEGEGLRLLLEPINSKVDIPGFLIDTTAKGLAAIEQADCGNIWLQYDVYHAQVMEGDLIRTMHAHMAQIGHIQIADNPGRHEPGTGEINFDQVFAAIDAAGYRGDIGCEYKPARTTQAGLDWLRSTLKTEETA